MSDERKKEVVDILENALDEIAKLEDVTLADLEEAIEFVTMGRLKVTVIDDDLIATSLR